MSAPRVPLFHHDLDAASELTPDGLMDAVRKERALAGAVLPRICVLEFDGDLTDWIRKEGLARPHPSWACFHTTMQVVGCDAGDVGIIDRTIGGPYTVLIAEQLHAAGVDLVIGLTSAGRIRPDLPLPCVVVASSAVRDEGTSFHYLPPTESVAAPTPIIDALATEIARTGATVHTGAVWTTDAPYRETATQIEHWARSGVLAVEMQGASLFAYGQARSRHVALVAIVSNGPGHTGPQFDTGGPVHGFAVLQAMARAGMAYLDG